jgi:hypothetical protein
MKSEKKKFDTLLILVIQKAVFRKRPLLQLRFIIE